MASYRLVIKREAEREIRAFPRQDVRRIIERLNRLAGDPRPVGCEKLQGKIGYRVRQGDYRIVYCIDDAARLVHILRVGHRREVYRQ